MKWKYSLNNPIIAHCFFPFAVKHHTLSNGKWTILYLACKCLRFMYRSTCKRLQYFLNLAALVKNMCSVCDTGHTATHYNIVTPFKFAAIKVRGFENMTYSRPFNFAVFYQNYFTVSYTNVVFSYTN